MLAYILRRLLYAIPILIGVNLLTFTLFFVVNSPDDMAVSQLGEKYVTPEAIQAWKEKNGYDKPLFLNESAEGAGTFTDTIFFTKSIFSNQNKKNLIKRIVLSRRIDRK